MRSLIAIALGLVMLTAACSTTTPTIEKVTNVSGVWIGDWAVGRDRGMFSMTLTQKGTDVAGAVQFTGLDRTSPTQVRGVLKGDEMHLVGMASTGVLKVSGNELTGVIERSGSTATVVARRQGD